MSINFFIAGVFGLALGGTAGFFLRKYLVQKKLANLEKVVRERISKAEEQAKQILLEAKNKAISLMAETEEEIKNEKKQLRKTQERLLSKEAFLDERTKKLDAKEEKLLSQVEKVKSLKQDLEAHQEKQIKELEQIAGLSKEQAKQNLIEQVERAYQADLFNTIKKLEQERSEELEKKANELVNTVVQRYSRSHIGEVSTSIVSLPNEDVKGKIIGKEGRNIRHFEKLTGVELVIDDTPDSIMLSCFDPVRREIAKIALEDLIQDGRIQPARIEEKIESAKKKVNQKIKEAGEQAVYELGIIDFPPEIVHLLGRLHFRTSYGQNALVHSIEVAHLCQMLAEELGLNSEIAKKAGLLHDIGKAVDHEIEGNHLELGIKILRKYKLDEQIILAMRSHHEDYPVAIPEAYVVNTGDAISAARPGARKESLESYVKRLADLEKIALEFKGVEKAYAIQAGRELRVFVSPEEINDYDAAKLAREVAEKIEKELRYPGEIKVAVFRETRAIEYAR
ncbi:MAG: ribonuclease Y [Patescibacteria group bacterium]